MKHEPMTDLDPQKELDGMQEKNRLLTAKNDEYKKLTEKFAEAKEAYSIAYASEMIRLKIDGTGVTIIKELAKGNKVVAELCRKMDIAKGIVDACKESMANIRSNVDSYRSRLAWLKAEYFRTE